MTTLEATVQLSPDVATVIRQQAALVLRAAALWRRHALALLAPLHLALIAGVLRTRTILHTQDDVRAFLA